MKLTILGGDERSIKLANLLMEDDYDIKAFGFEENYIDKSILCSTLEKALKDSDIIIGPIPLTRDKIFLNTPFYSTNIKLKDIFNNMKSTQILIAGSIPELIYNIGEFHNIKVIDLMEREEMSVLNGIPTAEGAIQIAMENMDIVLHGANALVLGFGRMGKILAKKLKGLDANVYVAARKIADVSWIEAYGYIPVNLSELNDYIGNMDVIFNTIPTMILDEDKLQHVDRDSLIIDIASAPGGVDFEKAKELNIKTVWALGLPGKVAPKTAAMIIKNTIKNIITELGGEWCY